ncbi:glycoside hydrolase family 16 protein [Kordiimonas aestuarii]|uniref:glycoside hydrolase family 16 protein n=1 Tax=Kordiimonas aestuarii TaxID=1005925 RepID=UPI0021CE546C|nr:glycoside hydrolase family 16 protein [Kordiimonas aestuarii]
MKTLKTLSAALILSTHGFMAAPTFADDMKLVWSDDFDGTALNTNAWHIVKGDGCPKNCYFGNNEKQTYTADEKNLRLEDGKLVIEARGGDKFTSAKITSKGIPGWTYGKIAMRAKLPSGVGTWPAFWMMPDEAKYGPWPKSGEIDIMEHVGFDQGHVHGTVHTEAYNHRINTQKGKDITVDTASSAFHTYTIEWDAGEIRWFIDSDQFFAFTRQDNDGHAEWPFDHPFHVILNLAVGGDWGGKEGIDEAAFPARYEIDWVKVWQ